MNLIWHTALSVFDLGSSLLYSLLGRDLTEDEIALIELLFKYMRKTKYLARQTAIKKKTNLLGDTTSVTGGNGCNNGENELKRIQLELKLARLDLRCLVDDFLGKVDFIGKDLLLISAKHNGYNLLQFSIDSMLGSSFRWLEATYKFYLNDEAKMIENEYKEAIEERMKFVRVLLEKYACDPNRGRRKFIITRL
jgi:hypothetical protein